MNAARFQHYNGMTYDMSSMPGTSSVNWSCDDEDDMTITSPGVQDHNEELQASADEPGRNKFACPYFKRDPGKFRNSRSCTGPGWATVRRTKEHLYRCHKAVFCPRCFLEFKDDKRLSSHIKETKCRQSPHATRPDGLDSDQVRRLRQRSRGKDKPEAQKWNEMYRIVFPNDDPDRMPSPYYDYLPVETSAPEELDEDMDRTTLQDCGMSEFQSRIRIRTEREIRPMLEDHSKQGFEKAVRVIQSMVREALTEFQRQGSAAGVASSTPAQHYAQVQFDGYTDDVSQMQGPSCDLQVMDMDFDCLSAGTGYYAYQQEYNPA